MSNYGHGSGVRESWNSGTIPAGRNILPWSSELSALGRDGDGRSEKTKNGAI